MDSFEQTDFTCSCKRSKLISSAFLCNCSVGHHGSANPKPWHGFVQVGSIASSIQGAGGAVAPQIGTGKKNQSYLLPITSLGELTYFKMLWAAHGSMSDSKWATCKASQHLSGGVNVALSL